MIKANLLRGRDAKLDTRLGPGGSAAGGVKVFCELQATLRSGFLFFQEKIRVKIKMKQNNNYITRIK